MTKRWNTRHRDGRMVRYKQVAGLQCIATEYQMENLTEEAIMAAREAKRQGDDQKGGPRNLKDVERKRERGPNQKAASEQSGTCERLETCDIKSLPGRA